MSGNYLDSNFSLPCPPGLDIPPEIVNPFTSNSLKVNRTRPETKFFTYLPCLSLTFSIFSYLSQSMRGRDSLLLYLSAKLIQ